MYLGDDYDRQKIIKAIMLEYSWRIEARETVSAAESGCLFTLIPIYLKKLNEVG